MIDETSEPGRILAAAMRLAADKPWPSVALLDIAEAAGLGLIDLKGHFASKGAILHAFSRTIDDDMLRRLPARTEGQAVRDALFEVVMSRFDALAPYRQALRSIARSGSLDPALLRSVMIAQHWMLQAAGIGTDGLGGGVRLAGLASVYAGVFQIWLDDDDPGFARTMAALDRRLRSGERTLRLVDDALGFAERLACGLSPFRRSGRGAKDGAAAPASGAETMAGASGTNAPH